MSLQPPFLAQQYTFWSLDPRRECRLSRKERIMIPFKKTCDKCKTIKTVKSLKTTEEFFDILEELKRLLVSENYEYAGGNNPADTIKNWPQD